MSDTDPKDESPSAEAHDTSASSTSSQADTPSHTESEQSQESQQEGAQSESQPEDAQSTKDSPSAPSTSPSTPDLEKARAFLRDPDVRKQTTARKATYLAQKGYSQEDIDVMLAEVDTATEKEHKEHKEHKPAATLPPIVTYPEFVANTSPQPPPPLVTPQVLAAALYGTAATSSLLYAAARLVLAPMVDALNDARSELHETAGSKLAALTEKLEGVVSVVPATTNEVAKAEAETEGEADDSEDSSCDDPAEVFHRDIGVQTSLPPSPKLPTVTMDSTVPNLATGLGALDANTKTPTASQVQADRVAALADSVRALSQGWVGSTDVHADIKATVDVFRDDVDKLTRPPAFTYGGGMYHYGGAASTSGSKHPGYVTTTRNEPDDEIRKAKENIRRVKGALLSTRTFPTAR